MFMMNDQKFSLELCTLSKGSVKSYGDILTSWRSVQS